MSRSREKKRLNDIIDSFYSLSLLIGLVVWGNTGKLWVAILFFICSMVLLFFCITKYKANKRKKLFDSGIDTIDNMPGEVFEEFLLVHFKNLGYTGELTPVTNDYGADLVLEKDKRRVVVQAKRWKGTVGVEAIQQVIGAIKHYDANKGMVVTNSTFSEQAYDLANSNGIELWDRKKLIEIMTKSKGKEITDEIVNKRAISKTDKAEAEPLKDDAGQVTKAVMICQWCGKPMKIRNGKNGQFWGCTGFPNCRYTHNL